MSTKKGTKKGRAFRPTLSYLQRQSSSVRLMEERLEADPAYEKELRAQYTAARDIINKRINTMRNYKVQKDWINPRNTTFYNMWKRGITPLKDTKGRQWLYILSSMLVGLQSQQSSVSGYKKSVKAGLQSLYELGIGVKLDENGEPIKGTEIITEKNLHEFGNFMETYRNLKLDHVYKSQEVAEMYLVLYEADIDQADFFNNFSRYMKRANELKRKVRKGTSKAELSSFANDIRKGVKRNGST